MVERKEVLSSNKETLDLAFTSSRAVFSILTEVILF